MKSILLTLLILSTTLVRGQTVNLGWAQQVGTASGNDDGLSIATDPSGNVYTAGTFVGTVDFDPGAGIFNLTSAGVRDIFVSKVDATGAFIWAKRLGTASSDFLEAITVDGSGNVYITGDFGNTMDFDPNGGVTNLISAGGLDMFITKWDTNGNLTWARRVGGSPGNDYGQAVAVDGTGNVHISGTFNGTVDFDPGAAVTNLTSAGIFDAYVLKLDASGNFSWARRMGGTVNEQAGAIALDLSGNVYTSGYFGGTADFDPGAGTVNLISAGSDDIFISKLDASGIFAWAKQVGGTASDVGVAIAMDNAGNVLVAGYFRNTADFDPGTGSSPLTSNGLSDAFALKLDGSGNYLWATQAGGIGSDFGFGVGADPSHNIYLIGNFSATADFDPGSGIFNQTPIGTSDIFISKLDVNGAFGWARQIGGPGANATPSEVMINANGDIVTTGSFDNTVDFDPGNCVFNLSSSGGSDVFTLALTPASMTTCIPAIASFSPSSGPVGTTVTINGSNFSSTPGNNIVFFGATKAAVTSSTNTQLTVTVPVGATYQPITVTVNNLTGYSHDPFIVTFPDGGIIDGCSFGFHREYNGLAEPYSINIADFDGDGKSDLIVSSKTPGPPTSSVSIYRNTAQPGNFSATSFASPIDLTIPGADRWGMATGDLDGDGKPEIVAVLRNSNEVSVYQNTSTAGSISFAAPVNFATGSSPWNVAIADIDVDGKPDLIVTNQLDDNISILKNVSTPGPLNSTSFEDRVNFNVGSTPYGVTVRDLDGNTKPEIVVANQGNSTVTVLQNVSITGTIDVSSFLTGINFTVGSTPTEPSIADFDGDGKPDIICANLGGTGSVSVLRNQFTAGSINAGSFAAKVDFTGIENPNGMDMADLDGDGKLDIAISADVGSEGLWVIKNTSTPGSITASPPQTFDTDAGPYDLVIGDLDGDGKPDVATANHSGASISVLRNQVSSLPPLTAVSFTPTSGPIGTPVTITGGVFSSTPSNNIVTFNGTVATVISSSSTSLSTTVPVGTTTGLVQVLVGCNGVGNIFPFTVTTGSCLPAIERAALIALYTATNGAAWTNNSGWLSGDESTWFGVTINACHVTGITLVNNNLVGPIPTPIGDLPFLEDLKLSFNHISGTLPSTITNLTNLQYLEIDNNNGISGPLPANIGLMTSLRGINTQGNAFAGPIPASMINCVALESIQLEGNQHTGSIPTYFNNFPNLFSINIGFNLLTGTIPASIANIPNLSFLSFADNDLTGIIPVGLDADTHLAVLDLSRNRLSGTIPVELGNLSELVLLELGSNQLTGTVPIQLGNLSSLVALNLFQNLLTGPIPPSLGNLGNLTGMNLSENQLTGGIPPELGNDTMLVGLYLYSNQLTGPIPIELSTLTNLETLDIFTNQLTGSLPKELALCTKLKFLEVADNQLSGTLPIEYGSLLDLEIFQINDNNITGSVPIEYLAWTKIEDLWLSTNQLDGLPTFTAGTITNLAVFNNRLEFGDLEPIAGVTGLTYTPQADLPGGTITIYVGNTLTIPFSTTGSANQYQWYKNGVIIPLATSATFGLPSATLADAGNYTVDITNTTLTLLTIHSLPFVVTVLPVINATDPSDFTACEGDIATFTSVGTGTTNITYQWQFSFTGTPVTFADISNGANYSGATTTTLSVNTIGSFGAGHYRCRVNGDLALEVITNDEGLAINPVPSPPGTAGNSGCASAGMMLTASGGSNGEYRWYTVPTGGTAIAGEVNITYITPPITINATYYVAINSGACESIRTSVLATVIPLPSPPTVTPGSSCAPSATVLLNASGGVNGQYKWYTTSTGGSPIPGETNGTYTTPVLSASVNYFVTIDNGICESVRVPVLAAIVSCTPLIQSPSLTTPVGGDVTFDLTTVITTINNALDVNSIQIIQQPSSGAIASIVNGQLAVSYVGISFAGFDQLTIEACDVALHCAQKIITVDVVGDITVYNAMSPNGDGQNDIFYIQYIDLLPDTKENKVTVFDRMGNVIFQVSNYDNANRVFKGISDNGSDVPSGTYFFKMEFTSGLETRTGFISLKR